MKFSDQALSVFILLLQKFLPYLFIYFWRTTWSIVEEVTTYPPVYINSGFFEWRIMIEDNLDRQWIYECQLTTFRIE